jgi:type IV pilus assembly protein PilW
MKRLTTAGTPRRARGVSLIELMVALVIGLVMIGGAITVYLKARDTYTTTDATARLQENARYAIALIESDVRMANFWGLNNRADFVKANVASAFPTGCGANYATDAYQYLAGTNNAYSLACAASGGGARPGSDVLIVRHASATRVTPQAALVPTADRDRVMIVSSRTAAEIFVPKDISNGIPTGYAMTDPVNAPPLADTRQMIAHAYYVSQNSTGANGYPALRRKFLAAGPTIADEELLPGVENLQFQIGVDMNGDATADVFVNPGAVPSGGIPVSVRIWLLLRAQDIDVSHVDSTAYVFADQNLAATNDQYRRMLVSKTVQLRNARP